MPDAAFLAAVGRRLVAHLDVEPVLQELLDTARELTGARYAAVGVLGEDGRELSGFVVRGIDDAARERIGSLPRGRGVLGLLADDPRPLRLDDVGAHPASYGFPAGHPRMRTFLGVPVLAGGRPWGNLYLTDKAGGAPFDDEDEATVVTLAAWAGIAVENARVYTQAEQRRAELEVAVRRLEATTAVARAVGTETDLQRVLELIVKRARALAGARSVVLTLADGDGLVVAAGAGQVRIGAIGTRLAPDGVLGRALAAGTAEVVPDAAARLPLADERVGVTGAASALLVPLRYRGTGLGILAAFDRLGDDPVFTRTDLELLEAFAASAATAVATAQTAERDRLRDSIDAAERERRRWARRLHDETLQGLGGVRLMLSNGLRSGDPAGLAAAAEAAAGEVATEIARLRRLITELRPAALDQLGLRPAIEALVHQTGDTHGLVTRATVTDSVGVRVGGELETTVYRIVQEALANAVRHARPHRIDVHLDRSPGRLEVTVADDGRGFDAAAAHPGFGLAGMRERAELAGGSLAVTSSPRGTTLTATFPLAG